MVNSIETKNTFVFSSDLPLPSIRKLIFHSFAFLLMPMVQPESDIVSIHFPLKLGRFPIILQVNGVFIVNYANKVNIYADPKIRKHPKFIG